MPVYKNKNRKYFRIQFRLNNRTFVKSSKTPDRRIAERMEDEWKAAIHARQYLGARDDITVRQILEIYLKASLAPATLRHARSFINVLPQYIDINCSAADFDQRELDRYRETRLQEGKMESSIQLHMRVFRSAWKRTNTKLYNVPDLKLPKFSIPKQKTEYLSEDDEQRLLSYLLTRKPHGTGVSDWKYEMHDLVVTLLDTGARYNEIARLEWKQVDVKQMTLELWRGKTNTASYIYMTDRVHRVLQRRSESKKHELWVFTNRECTSHRTDNTTYLNQTIKAAGVPYTVHTLRHTFATKLLKAGMTLNDVRVLLGHTSIQTTLRYGHLEASDASPKAVAILNDQHVHRNRSKLKVI